MAVRAIRYPLRPNVCMLVYNAKGQLFLGERVGRRGHWQFPQGGVEGRGSLKENVMRELWEELGLTKGVIGKVRKLKARHRYLWRKIPDYASGKWWGQSQTFWLVEFLGDDSDIVLDASQDPEFRDWRWCSVTMVRKCAAKERRLGYEAALLEFLDFKRARLVGKKRVTRASSR